MLTTHRLIQIHALADALASHARVSRRAADKAASINNRKANAYFLQRATRMERIVARCVARLENA
ncbi:MULTISPECIES: hypothetical protein [Paraburkholderia]|uniref:Uncharacterized protein n=1 Tax=Paraburkholderia madseniana TaxID=2599607 RepID=A0AAP5BJJ5_9BURK|nr:MULTISPECIES: hypothetical protein [Paraburkholderia]MCX4150986.1 hypothetical protein [Paraburkholderia madseniana]MCX4176626.1 hypothetical protein [Paraburkholderia madseniana]MDN7153919.1 hypothetical protein [Paraburkholderia sp. WS6]MDQ6412801.1 hypothetical protein [Paraburkholderia madseniana]MDQ6464618.1 hypothetical protein [Paraburkholderia madseniana]